MQRVICKWRSSHRARQAGFPRPATQCLYLPLPTAKVAPEEAREKSLPKIFLTEDLFKRIEAFCLGPPGSSDDSFIQQSHSRGPSDEWPGALFVLASTLHKAYEARSLRQMRMRMDVSTLRTTKDARDGADVLTALRWHSQQAGQQMLDAAGHTEVAHGLVRASPGDQRGLVKWDPVKVEGGLCWVISLVGSGTTSVSSAGRLWGSGVSVRRALVARGWVSPPRSSLRGSESRKARVMHVHVEGGHADLFARVAVSR